MKYYSNKKDHVKSLLLIITTTTALMMGNLLYASPYCDYGHAGGYGPFDYTNSDHKKNKLPVVESYHFQKNIENLIPSGTVASLGADIDYTLRAFPNHHRALSAMSRLSLRDKQSKPTGATHSALCYFERATRFKPDDAMVRSLFGSHLLGLGKLDMALEQLILLCKSIQRIPLLTTIWGYYTLRGKIIKKLKILPGKLIHKVFLCQASRIN